MMMFPTDTQIAAYKRCGYLIASPQFDARREQFERWSKIGATPLVIIWPLSKRSRSITMQLFNCTTSILDEEFQAAVRDLARIWGASDHQAHSLPVSVAGVTPRNAQILAGYLHQLGIEAYERRAKRVRKILVVEGKASDGKPKKYGSARVYPVKGQRSFTCTLQLDNGEIFQCGLIGVLAPESDYVRQLFTNEPGTFRLLNAPAD